MKRNLLLVIGIAVLVFAALAYAGNFLQWSSSTKVTATIANAREQWVRKGENMVKINIQYPVSGNTMSGTVYLLASQMESATKNNEIEVFYMNKKPDRVIPVIVLQEKQKTVPILTGIGFLLTCAGIVIRVKRRS